MSDLKVTLIQSHLHWENPKANRAMFSEKISKISEETDLIILPEMFTTGFSMNAHELAEEAEGETLSWMQGLAEEKDAAMVGSVMVAENGKYYNRLYFVFPDGSYGCYDKRHAFTLAGEQRVFTVGSKKLVVEYKDWKICPLICYDLRFPVWSRNTEEYDVILYVANWPKKRIIAWDALLKARAIENMSYCIGVNRVGLDGNNHEYVGHSIAFDILGAQISSKDFEKEFTHTLTLSKQHIKEHREHLPFLKDRDSFTLQ